MTRMQKDLLWRLCSLAVVLFIFGYIIVSRVGFHAYYNEIIANQQRIESLVLENRKLITEKR